MPAAGLRVDLPPAPGGIAWLDVSADKHDSWPLRVRTGPLGLQIAPLYRARSAYYFRGARLRGTRCMWSASTVSGAELSRSGRPAPPPGEGSVQLLIRADCSGSAFDPASVLTHAVVKVVEPAAPVAEQFHTNSLLCTLNAHQPTVGVEPVGVTAMYGQSFPLTAFQTLLLRSAISLLVTGTDELSSTSSLIGVDRYIGAFAGLLLRTMMNRNGESEHNESVRTRTDAIIYEQATDPGLTPAAIAAQLNVSLRQLYRAFNGTESPAALIRRRRLERAAELLAARHTGVNVESVAQECGFTSAEYFSRAFRREFGMSPRAYRSAHREQPA
jgi:AraC-like DNA-binding protein